MVSQDRCLPSSEQVPSYGLHGPRENIRLCPLFGYLVGPEKTRCRGVDCVVFPGNVCQCAKWGPCCRGLQQEFGVKARVYQDSVLSPLLFIIVLEALSHKFHSTVSWEDLGICR